MSIATRTGDSGTTGLMYNRRLSKCDARVEAGGSVDELNATLGLVRAASTEDFVRSIILRVQKELVILMGEMATLPEDLPRYVADGFSRVTSEMTRRLDEVVKQVESEKVPFAGWATPGATMVAATLDLARTACRRSERRACALHEAGSLENAEILVYLNRLSDVLWLLARWEEGRVGVEEK